MGLSDPKVTPDKQAREVPTVRSALKVPRATLVSPVQLDRKVLKESEVQWVPAEESKVLPVHKEIRDQQVRRVRTEQQALRAHGVP